MSTIIVQRAVVVGTPEIIPLNVRGYPYYSIALEDGGVLQVQGTLTPSSSENRVWFTIQDDEGNDLDAISDVPSGTLLKQQPLQAIRLQATSSTCFCRIVQMGGE